MCNNKYDDFLRVDKLLYELQLISVGNSDPQQQSILFMLECSIKTISTIKTV